MSISPKANTVKCVYLLYKGKEHIKLDFLYDYVMKNIIWAFPESRWSQTYKCWHIPKDRAVLKRLKDHLDKESVVLDISPLLDPDHKQRLYKPRNQNVLSPKIKLGPIGDDTMDKIHDFERYMTQSRYSASTIKSYVSMIKYFFARNHQIAWDEVTQEVIQEDNYSFFIQGKRSYSAQNQSINALKLFYKFNHCDTIIPEEIERPRKVRYLPNVLTKQEVKQILLSTWNIKHRCMLTVVYGGGLRIGEVLNLKLDDIRFTEQLLYIRNAKGHKDRRVPLSDTMSKIIKEYTIAYKPKQYLFEGQKGGQYSYKSAQQVLRRALKRTDIKIRVTLHTLRHSYATHLLESGVGLRYIQDILGHKSPKTTMIYTHVSGKKLSEVRSPLEDMDL